MLVSLPVRRDAEHAGRSDCDRRGSRCWSAAQAGQLDHPAALSRPFAGMGAWRCCWLVARGVTYCGWIPFGLGSRTFARSICDKWAREHRSDSARAPGKGLACWCCGAGCAQSHGADPCDAARVLPVIPMRSGLSSSRSQWRRLLNIFCRCLRALPGERCRYGARLPVAIV